MRKYLSIYLLALIGSISISNGQSVNFTSWQLDENTNGLKIYSKDSTGSLKKFGAEFTIQTNMTDALHLLKSVDAYEDWIEGIQEAVSIGKPDQNEYSYHFYINRKILLGLYEIKKDGIVKSVVSNNGEIYTVESNIDRDALTHEEYDRIEHYQVKWTLVPKANGIIQVYYLGVVDVQLNFAYQIIKSTILENLQSTFKNMRKKLSLLYSKS